MLIKLINNIEITVIIKLQLESTERGHEWPVVVIRLKILIQTEHLHGRIVQVTNSLAVVDHLVVVAQAIQIRLRGPHRLIAPVKFIDDGESILYR